MLGQRCKIVQHVHCLCTIRGFKKDGSWDVRERKEYALDENGERIPEIDPKTGQQKIREKKKNGKVYQEKVWKRVTVQANPWNSRKFLRDLKKSWVTYCNGYLVGESQIDNRSTHEGETNRVPLLHEGAEARAALERGIEFDVIKENRERREINAALCRIEKLIASAKAQLSKLREKLENWREYEKRRSFRATSLAGRNGAAIGGLPTAAARGNDGAGEKPDPEIIKSAAELEQRTQKIRRHRR